MGKLARGNCIKNQEMKGVLAKDTDDKDYGSIEVQRIFWEKETTWYL